MKHTDIGTLAYRGGAPPADPLERAQYYMMQRLYELHKRGTLTKEDGAYLKKLVLCYESLEKQARLELLDSFALSWYKEDLRRFKPEIKAISVIYAEEL